MSDEEKKAMKYFYNLRATIDESNMLFDEDIAVKCGKETIKQITIILNLIEELKERYERVNKRYLKSLQEKDDKYEKLLEYLETEKEKEITKLNNEIYELKKRIHAINLLSYGEE